MQHILSKREKPHTNKGMRLYMFATECLKQSPCYAEVEDGIDFE